MHEKEKLCTTIFVMFITFYRATNAIFGKIGRLASEEVILLVNVCQCCCLVWKPVLLINLNYRHWILL